MTATVTHAFNCALADDPKAAAAGEILVSHWNAAHVITGLPTVLEANTTYYLSTTGSDSNDGLSPATAWATFLHAVNSIGAIDANGFNITLQIEDGTYHGNGITSVPLDCPAYTIQGNTGASTNVTITDETVTWGSCVFLATANSQCLVSYVKFLVTNAAGDSCIATSGQNADLSTNFCTFQNATGSPTTMCFAFGATNSISNSNATYVGGGGNWDRAILLENTFCSYQEVNVTQSGTPNYGLNYCEINSTAAHCFVTFSIFGAFTGNLITLSGDSFVNPVSIPAASSNPRIIINGLFGGITYGQANQSAGLPTTTDIAAGTWNVWKDTTGGGVYLVYNDSGTIKKVALT